MTTAVAAGGEVHDFSQSSLVLYLNGERVEMTSSEVDPRMTLVEFLHSRGLTGTKIGCSEGGCGACTVMISHFDHASSSVKHRSVAACLLPLPYVDHMSVTTVEGVSHRLPRDSSLFPCDHRLRPRQESQKSADLLHPIQEHLAEKHATQCGFCTPGIVMSLYSASSRAAASGTELSMRDVEECLDGNLCRCTGYRPILEAAHAFASDHDAAADDGKLTRLSALADVCPSKLVSSIPFPDELKEPLRPLRLVGKCCAWYRPVTLAELLDLKTFVPEAQVLGGKHSFPDAAPPKLISGNTEIGYKARYHPTSAFQSFVSTAAVKELHDVEAVTGQGVRVGVATTINGLAEALAKHGPQDTGFAAVRSILRVFANNQVRDMGTVGGSLITCDPLSDLYPALVCLGSTLRLQSRNGGIRDVKVDEFVAGENKVDLRPDEVAVSVFLPFTKPREFAECYKTAKRRVDAQAVVNAGLKVKLGEQDNTVVSVTLAFGAVGKRAAERFVETEKFLLGKQWNEQTILAAVPVIRKEAEKVVARSRGMTEYRCTVVPSLLYRFFVAVCSKAGIKVPERCELTHVDSLEGQPHMGNQDFNDPWAHDKALGKPHAHLAAYQHVTGEAKFVADESFTGLHAALALTSRGHARLVSVDPSEALKCPGVKAVYTAADIPGSNLLGSIVADEEVLASKEVKFFDQPGAIVVADTHAHARLASQKVSFAYGPEDELQVIGTIEEAIAANSYLCEDKTLKRGEDVDEIFKSWPSDKIVRGEVRVGGQEHFYIEPMAALVWPGADKFVVHCTSQNPAKIQRAVASVLGVPAHLVESSMERIGGGFGGKQDRPQFIAAAAAIAACRCGKPVSLVLERDTDMKITGQRHEFLVRYRIAHTAEGVIKAFDAELYSNGGFSLDLSPAVMEVALFAIDNCYRIPNCRLVGRCCRTNRISCTAYRGFGKPQGIAAVESMLDHIARNCKLSPMAVRERNILHAGDALIDGEVVDDCLDRCWAPLRDLYHKKAPAVAKFNKENRYRKRGLALTPAKNNMGFETDWMNQGGALLNIYNDGSVHVSHGGCEMGQGLHTKVAQAVADELGISLEKVTVGRSGSERVPNTHPTAACTGTELNTGAAIDAARQINERIAEVRAALGKSATWEAVVKEAYFRRINLSASGHYALPQFTYDWKTGKGLASFYRIWGASLSEVELDVLTGSWRIVSTDIIQDNGSGLNPAIDVGQVEGGFVQGLGLFTLEELLWAKDGHLRTRNVSTYKIPTHDDVPIRFNVSLLKGVTNTRAVKGNKTVGEAGLQLAVSVVHAIKDAVYAAREEFGAGSSFFQLDTPATCERIRLACPTPFNH